MDFTMRKPCARCPFRTDCRPGWLGYGRALEIADGVTRRQGTFACHETTVDSPAGDGSRVEGPKARHCAGAMILLEKIGRPNQMMRIMERLGFYDHTRLDMAAPVFDTPAAFVRHHDARAAMGRTKRLPERGPETVVSDDELNTLAGRLRGTKGDVYALVKGLYPGKEFADADFGRMEKLIGLFRCENCGEWRNTVHKDLAASCFCIDCVEEGGEADE